MWFYSLWTAWGGLLGSRLLPSPGDQRYARVPASTHQAGTFLKERSAIVRAICRDKAVCHTRQAHPWQAAARQRLLCSGASISDSAEEVLAHNSATAPLEECLCVGSNAWGGEYVTLGLGWSRLPGQLHNWCAGLKTLLLGPNVGGK